MVDIAHTIFIQALLISLVSSQPDALNACRGTPVLPSSLDSAGYLGSSSDIHLHGSYMMDFGLDRHEMMFHIQEKSLLRVVVQPHVVDIDVRLAKIDHEQKQYLQSRLELTLCHENQNHGIAYFHHWPVLILRLSGFLNF
jgi:hypothetical protein